MFQQVKNLFSLTQLHKRRNSIKIAESAMTSEAIFELNLEDLTFVIGRSGDPTGNGFGGGGGTTP